MSRPSMFVVALSLFAAFVSACVRPAAAVEARTVSGSYLEARTCQVYTGPCFANGESSLTGQDAMMAWNIESGRVDGQNLAGLSVVVVVGADATLGFQGFGDAKELKAVVMVDEKASGEQAEALVKFARQHAGAAGKNVARVDRSPISMSLDTASLDGKLEVGKTVRLVTRKANQGDCICSNETAYYPPLAKVENFAAGVTIDGEFRGRGLGRTWSIPATRSAYMATFAYGE
ncbi:MAG: DUF1326 domain-containing protein [Pirellulales bacterium]